jgi:hypothetical protein
MILRESLGRGSAQMSLAPFDAPRVT